MPWGAAGLCHMCVHAPCGCERKRAFSSDSSLRFLGHSVRWSWGGPCQNAPLREQFCAFPCTWLTLL